MKAKLLQQVIDENDDLSFDKLFFKELLRMTHLDDLMYASEEDIKLFHQATAGLPGVEGFSGTGFDASGERIPYGVGPHSVKCFRQIIDYVKPKNILEIGTNLCYSSSLWLMMSDANIVTVDISSKAETKAAVEFMNKKHGGNKFFFILEDSAHLLDTWETYLRRQNFDTAFIDGGHLEHHVMADIGLCLKLGIKWIVFDDVLPQFGPGVIPAIQQHPQLKEVVTIHNIALYENTAL